MRYSVSSLRVLPFFPALFAMKKMMPRMIHPPTNIHSGPVNGDGLPRPGRYSQKKNRATSIANAPMTGPAGVGNGLVSSGSFFLRIKNESDTMKYATTVPNAAASTNYTSADLPAQGEMIVMIPTSSTAAVGEPYLG